MSPFVITSRLSGTRARTGLFTREGRSVHTPELAIVATEGEIRCIPKEMWKDLPCKYVIVNTYHTYAKNKIPRFERAGDIHGYMGLSDNIIATDSGGFQVFSLGFGKAHQVGKNAGKIPGTDIRIDDQDTQVGVTEEGASFIYDGTRFTLSPEKSMDLQHRIGADIMFAFDECTSPFNSYEYTRKSMERTHRWLDRCIDAHRESGSTQYLFGIVQGGEFRDLREESARVLAKKDVPGYGLGGSLGKFKEEVHAILDWIISLLPDEKPRHFLGIGQVRDIFEGVERGVDLFDCVIPTREARHRMVYTRFGRHSLRKLKSQDGPIDKDCACMACQEGLTPAQLWQLFLLHDPRAPMYTTHHNIYFFARLMSEVRESLRANSFFDLKNEYFRFY